MNRENKRKQFEKGYMANYREISSSIVLIRLISFSRKALSCNGLWKVSG